jgi:hypothetical protein
MRDRIPTVTKVYRNNLLFPTDNSIDLPIVFLVISQSTIMKNKIIEFKSLVALTAITLVLLFQSNSYAQILHDPGSSSGVLRSGAKNGKKWFRLSTSSHPYVYVSSGFSLRQIGAIEFASWHSRSYNARPTFLTCVNKYTNSPDTSKIVGLVGKKTLFIDMMSGSEIKPGTLANAQRPLRALYNVINLNPNEIPDIELGGVISEENTKLLYRLSGVILHEVLHNSGYAHDEYDRSSKDEDREGNFVYEAGWCLGRSNRDKEPGSLGLTGSTGYHVD